VDPLIGMGVLAFIGAVAAVAGYTEDMESVVGSQSNPNSQVQLAPQMKYPHRLFNKAISGEPLSNAMAATVGAVVAYSIGTYFDIFFITEIIIGALAATAVHVVLSATSFFGRIASQSRFKQPLYMDVFKSNIPTIAAYAFMTTACVLMIAYLMIGVLEFRIPIPIMAFILGITVGSIGSSVGDIQYGAERLFQNIEFGAGVNAAYSGNIVRKAESGLRWRLSSALRSAQSAHPSAISNTALKDCFRISNSAPASMPLTPEILSEKRKADFDREPIIPGFLQNSARRQRELHFRRYCF